MHRLPPHRVILATLMVAGLSPIQAVRAQAPAEHEHHHKALGQVHFSTSCKPDAQRLFNQAMLYQHSFWYRAAKQTFEEVIKADPECVIAYWGIAQSLLLNPYAPPPPKNLEEGLVAIEKAKSVGAKTQRENDYIGAIGMFYANHNKIAHGPRLLAYLKATEDVARRYPNDDEAQIYYALALSVAAPSGDKSYTMPLKAAAILEPIFKREPQHPGVAHYLVHSYDYPPIAEKGLNAAKRYAEIAGASPHALHMPSHIFTRVGHWKESIESNIASARVARQDKEPDDLLHAMDYLVYAQLQLGQDANALAVLDEMRTVTGVNAARHTGPFALAASSARYAIERGDWKAASALPLRPTRFAHVDAITHFARALGAARTGQPDAAKAEIAKLVELRDKLRESKDVYWSEQVDILRQVAIAWTHYAAGDYTAALKDLAAAADAEDKTDKHVVTPGPLVPARELYGYMLLERGMAREALAAFEATLKKEPRRLGATLGAAKAAEKAGDLVKARQYFSEAVSLAEGADPIRTEIAAARKFVARKQ
jgi:tetratricopeptide (TPR) repeat protein